MARSTRIIRPGFIYLPIRRYRLTYRVVITTVEGVSTDVTNYMQSGNIQWSIGRLATATVTLVNNNGKWVDVWSGGESIDIYAEYGEVATPTNKIFSGRVDDPLFSFSSNGYLLTLVCRQTPELADIRIVEQYTNELVTTAIQDIITKYYTGIISFPDVPTTTVRYTGSFRHVSGISAIATIADKAGMDVYVDTNDELQVFTRGSVNNDAEYVSYETNLVSISNYGRPTSKIFNNAVVYGKEEDSIILLKTEQDTSSISSLWRKDNVITDNSLSTMEEVQEKADVSLRNTTTDIVKEGTVNTLGMPEIKPGQNIAVTVPNVGAHGYQNIKSLSHTINSNGFVTVLDISKRKNTIVELFKDRINAEEQLKPYNNLNNMTDAYTIFFDESPDKVTLTNTEIVDNRCKFITGETSGGVLADTITTDNNVIQCELRITTNYPNHELCTFVVSNNGGSTWETVEPGVLHTFMSTGSELTFRINMIGDSTHNPVFDKICLLYKQEL